MGQELLDHAGWIRKPRTYYLAVTSTGLKFVRGSCEDKYTHAVVCSKAPHFRPQQIETYGWCHSRLDLAKRNFNRYKKFREQQSNEYEYELVELQKINAKEVRQIKKITKKEYNEYYAQQQEEYYTQQQQESEGTKEDKENEE
jgi:hypothetical protein